MSSGERYDTTSRQPLPEPAAALDERNGVVQMLRAMKRNIVPAARTRVFLPENPGQDLFTPEQWLTLAENIPLTVREWEIAMRLCEGMSRKLIARTLRISPETVRTHIDAVYAKLQVENVVGCVLRLVRLNQEWSGKNSAGVTQKRE